MTFTIPFDMTGMQAFFLAACFLGFTFMFRDLRYALWKAMCLGASVAALVWIVARVS